MLVFELHHDGEKADIDMERRNGFRVCQHCVLNFND